MVSRRIEDALQQLRAEYLSAPRLSLESNEVARILNIDPPTARTLLDALKESHFLKCSSDGRFTLAAQRR